MDVVVHGEVPCIHDRHVHTKLGATQRTVSISRDTLHRGQHTFSVKGPTENVLGHVSVARAQPCCCGTETHRLCVRESLRLCSTKTELSETSSRLRWPVGLQAPGLGKAGCGGSRRPPYLDGVVKENPVHGFSDGVHSSEGEGQVGKTATDFGSR